MDGPDHQLIIETKAESHADLSPGTVIGDNFEILEFVGHGASSTVWKARQVNLDRSVAIKMLKRRLESSAEDYKRIRNEANSLRQLSHAHILSVYGMGEWNQHLYLAVEFIEGTTLQSEIEKHGRLPLDRCFVIARQCLDALGHAHANGIVHRDIKPANIMLTRNAQGNEVVKIVDFGIAKVLEQQLDGKVTGSTQLICGSPYYMSPEQCMGRKLDQRSDIYSFACVLHEMLTGNPPFAAETAVATMMMHTNEPFPLIDRRLQVPSAVQVAILRAVVKNRDERLQNTREFIDALNDTTSGVMIPSQHSHSGAHQPRSYRRLLATGVSTLAAVAFGAGLCLYWFQYLESTQEDQIARMSRDLQAQRTTLDKEVRRIRALADKKVAARQYCDLIDIVDNKEKKVSPELAEVALSAAEFMSQVPDTDERIDMRRHLTPVLARLWRTCEKPANAAELAACSDLYMRLSALAAIADGRKNKSDCPIEMGRTGLSLYKSDPQRAAELLKLALAWSEATHNQEAIAANWLYMGSYYIHKEQFSEADRCFAKAVTTPQPNSDIRASTLFMQSQLSKRRRDAKAGTAYFEKGLIALRKATGVNPDSAVAQRELTLHREAVTNGSLAASFYGSKEQRYALIRNALRGLPRTSIDLPGEYSTMLADVYFQNQDLPGALQALDEGLIMIRNRADVPARYLQEARLLAHKADILRHDHRWKSALTLAQEARQNLERAGAANANMHDWYNLNLSSSIIASCQMQLGHPEAARASLQEARAAADNAGDQRAQLLLNTAFRCKSGMPAECVAILDQITKLPDSKDFRNSDAFQELGENLCALGRHKEAQAAYLSGWQWQIAHSPPNLAATIDCHWEFKMALVAQAERDWQSAVRHMARSIELQRRQPPNATLSDKLAIQALCLAQAKERNKADQAIEEAARIARTFPRAIGKELPLDPFQVSAYQRIAQYYQETGRWRKTLQIYDDIKPYFQAPASRHQLSHSGQSYISLLRRVGRKSEADTLEKFYATAAVTAAKNAP